jgi:hypothetical protein
MLLLQATASVNGNIGLLRAQLAQVIEEKNELNRKFIESRKALQSTGELLLKVHNHTLELKNERNEHKAKLEGLSVLNKALNEKVVEMSTKLEEINADGGMSKATITDFVEKLLSVKEEHIRAIEQQQVQLQTEMSKLRKENSDLLEAQREQQELILTTEQKIATLEKFSALERISSLEKLTSSLEASRLGVEQERYEWNAAHPPPRTDAPLPDSGAQFRPPSSEKPSSAIQSPRRSVNTLSMQEVEQSSISVHQASIATIAPTIQQLSSTESSFIQLSSTESSFIQLSSTESSFIQQPLSTESSFIKQLSSTESSFIQQLSMSVEPSTAPILEDTASSVTSTEYAAAIAMTLPLAVSTAGPEDDVLRGDRTEEQLVSPSPVQSTPTAAIAQESIHSEDCYEPSSGGTLHASGLSGSIEPSIASRAVVLLSPIVAAVAESGTSPSPSGAAGTVEQQFLRQGGLQKRKQSLVERAVSQVLWPGSLSTPMSEATDSSAPESLSAMIPLSEIVAKYADPSWKTAFARQPDEDDPSYKERLLRCKKAMKKDIFSWSKSFVLEHRRAPSKEDKKSFGQDVFKVYSQVSCCCCCCLSVACMQRWLI